MPKRKPTTRSGPTIEEVDRLSTRMTLRLDRATTTALEALARRWGLVRSQAIARAILEAVRG